MQTNSTGPAFRVLSSDDRTYGPIDLPTLIQWVRERRVQRGTWVLSVTSNHWTPAGSVNALGPEFDALTDAERAADAPASSQEVTVEELRQFERFAPYSNDELALLLSFCEVVVAVREEVIIKKGDVSDSIFLLISGRVRARMKVGGVEKVLGRMEPGELFGEVAMLSQTARSADVVAEGPSRLLQLTSERFQEMMSEHAALAVKMLYNMSRLLATRLSERNAELQKDLAASNLWQ